MTTPDRDFTHINEHGAFEMVDVGHKPISTRSAVASGHISMQMATYKAIKDNDLKKGDVVPVARLAGIQAAKKTADLIPLCHPLQLSKVDVQISLDEAIPGCVVHAMVKTTGQTGVEMEALTAVSVALLTIYDMAKAMDRTMVISEIVLREKHGGTSGSVINRP